MVEAVDSREKPGLVRPSESLNGESQSPKIMLLLSRISRVQLCVTPQTAAHQAPLSLGFSKQEYWSGLPYLSAGDLPNPGI